MERILELKEEHARDLGYTDWNELLYSTDDPDVLDSIYESLLIDYGDEMYSEGLRDMLNTF